MYPGRDLDGRACVRFVKSPGEKSGTGTEIQVLSEGQQWHSCQEDAQDHFSGAVCHWHGLTLESGSRPEYRLWSLPWHKGTGH